MKAIVQERYGTSEVLEVAEIEKPQLAAERVLIRVKAAGVNMMDWHGMTGLPLFMRIAGSGLIKPKDKTLGTDVAGVIEEVGSEVTDLKVGEEVFGTALSSFAEFATSRPIRLVAKPRNLTFEQAAVIPVAGYTALQAIRDKAKVVSGQKVLIIGAAGGVGAFAVQLAKHFGAEVTGVCSTSKVDFVRSLGADQVVDYRTQSITGRFDAIIDTAGNRPLRDLRKLLTPRGTLVLVGGEGAGRMLGPLARTVRASFYSLFVSQRIVGFVAKLNPEDLASLAKFAESGVIQPHVDKVFGLDQAAEAIDALAAGKLTGKAVLIP